LLLIFYAILELNDSLDIVTINYLKYYYNDSHLYDGLLMLVFYLATQRVHTVHKHPICSPL
jgi:hypothetical protein